MCGSPSSRLPRQPRWPLDRANSDSVWAISSGSNLVSVRHHGSTANVACLITAGPQAQQDRRRRCPPRARRAVLPGGPRPPEPELVLAVAQAADRLRPRRIRRLALRQLDAPRGQENPRSLGARSAVNILVVVTDRVERNKRLAGPLGAATQEVVKHFLPRRVVNQRSLGQDAVEVEQAPAHLVRKAQHPLQPTDSKAPVSLALLAGGPGSPWAGPAGEDGLARTSRPSSVHGRRLLRRQLGRCRTSPQPRAPQHWANGHGGLWPGVVMAARLGRSLNRGHGSRSSLPTVFPDSISRRD